MVERPAIRFYLCVIVFGLLALRAEGQFETRGLFVAEPDSSPYSIAVGDFNHDGNLDLAVASGCCPGAGVIILLGKGNGTFREPGVYYSAGEQPTSIVAADFNHDGNLDLAVANSLSDYLSILIGNGDGTFQPPTQSPPVSNPNFVTVGDFNGDGILDLLAFSTNNPCKCISVLFGNGDGTFQTPVFTEPSYAMQAIGVGDFNGDGKLDVATSGTVNSLTTVNILLGNGDGTFRQGASYPGQQGPFSIAVADYNNDHKLDLAIASIGYISIFLGNGDGTFQNGWQYHAVYPEWVTTADLNGDHNLDLVAAGSEQIFGPGGAIVLLGNGDGTFRPDGFYRCDFETTYYVAVGDLNRDGMPDLVIADYLYPYDTVTVLLNTGLVSFTPTTPLDFKQQPVGTTSNPLTVTLTNNGTTDLQITSIKVTIEFDKKSNCHATIAPGASCQIQATFSPQSVGQKRGSISIIDSASSKPQVIYLLGKGT